MKYNIKLRVTFFVLVIGVSSMLMAQNDETDSSTATSSIYKNTIFLEAGGAGILYSLNYERKLFDNKKIRLWGRLGLSFIPQKEVGFILTIKDFKPEIPFGLSIVYNNKKDNISFEQSVFLNFLLFEIAKYNSKTYYNYGLYAGLQLIGFRLHNSSKSLYFKGGMGIMANLYELYFNDILTGKQNDFLRITKTNISMMFSLSIGYMFKAK